MMEGLRVLYMIREFDMTDREELLKVLLANDSADASETTECPSS